MINMKIFKFCLILFFLIFLIYIISLTFKHIDKNNLALKRNDKERVEGQEGVGEIVIITKPNKKIVALSIITYDEIDIDWGDGNKEKFQSFKVNEKVNLVTGSGDNSKDSQKDMKRDSGDNIIHFVDNVIYPTHKYDKNKVYKIRIKGSTRGGIFSDFSFKDEDDNILFNKEFGDRLDTKNDIQDITECIEQNKQIREKQKDNLALNLKISKFSNLDFKGLGNMTYFAKHSGEDILKKIASDEFNDISVLWDTFKFSDMYKLPTGMFEKKDNLRVLNSVFLGNKKISNIDNNMFSKGQLEKIETFKYCFAGCKNLEGDISWILDDIQKMKKEKLISKYNFCFTGCDRLKDKDKLPIWLKCM